ncbi:MAG: autotransporter domain-containing protein [Planctomycetaceae bacterium]|jgi:hypothetical protein|nr:autotransporter domain-containing protein [Planctomycetaceae bacterium]
MSKKERWKYVLPGIIAAAMVMTSLNTTFADPWDGSENANVALATGVVNATGTWDDVENGASFHIADDIALTLTATNIDDTVNRLGNITTFEDGKGSVTVALGTGDAKLSVGNIGTSVANLDSLTVSGNSNDVVLNLGNVFASTVTITTTGEVNMNRNGNIGTLTLNTTGGILNLNGGGFNLDDANITNGTVNINSGFVRVGKVTTLTGDVNAARGTTLALGLPSALTAAYAGDIKIYDGAQIQVFNATLGTNYSNLFTGHNKAWLQNPANFWDRSLLYKIDLEDGVAKVRNTLNASDGFLAAMMMHNKYTMRNAVRDRMISGDGGNRSGYFGQAPCDPVCGSESSAKSAWVNYIGRGDTYRSSYGANHDWKLTMDGVQVGSDLYRTRNSQVGMLFGYEGGRMVNDRGFFDRDQTNLDDLYFGVYAAQVLRSGADIRGSFAYGWQNYGMSRYEIHDNGIYTSSFNGYTTESSLEVGKRFVRGAWSVRPVLGLDVSTNNLKAAEEKNADDGDYALKYDKTSLRQVFLRPGVEMRLQGKRATLNTGLFYAYDMNNNELQTRVNNGTNNAILAGSKLGRSLLTLNVGGEYQMSKHFSLFGGYEGQYTLDGAAKGSMNAGYVGSIVKW